MNTEIKTVYWKANERATFDTMVNRLLAEGWKLGRVDIVNDRVEDKSTMLFALLFRQDQNLK